MNLENFCCNHCCSRCGSCCGMGIPISRKEEKRIRDYIKENNIMPESLYEDNNFYAICCFYDRKNKKCKIYDVRPKICQSFKCDRAVSTILKERDINQRNAYWNQIDKQGNIHHMTSFDLLFYNDPKPILQYITSVISGKNDETKYGKIIEFLKLVDLEELADSLSPVYEKE